MEFGELMYKGFAVIDLDPPSELDDVTNLKPIYGIYAVNESGKELRILNFGRELGRRDYEILKSFLGDRVMCFRCSDRGDYESLLFASALSGVAIRNESISFVATFSYELGLKHFDSMTGEFSVEELVKDIILSGSYFDGKDKDTRDVANGSFIAHGDVTGLNCIPLKHRSFPCRALTEGKAIPFLDLDPLLKSARKTRLIVSLYDPLKPKPFYLITTDGKGDPACGGLFPILNDPELAKLYKEHGLSYFSDWRYMIEDVFSKDIDIKVVKGYLAIIKWGDKEEYPSWEEYF